MTIESPSQRQPERAESLIEQLRIRQRRVSATWGLIAANLLVAVVMATLGAGLWHSPNDLQLAWGANFGPATQDGQWWRLGTAMFIHFGVLHLAMNTWALWDCGNVVERIFGPSRFLAVYAGSGLVGNVVSLATQGNQAVSAGASGAIFGLYGALLVALWQERSYLHPREFAWLFWGAAAFLAAIVSFGLLVPGIDNAAHIGGLGTGALLGIVLYRPIRTADPIMRPVRLAAAGIIATTVAFLMVNLPAPPYKWSEESAARDEIHRFLRQEASLGEEWSALAAKGNPGQISFEQLAIRLDTDIASRYEHSFDQLSRLSVSPGMPSAATVQLLRGYADLRREESHVLAEGLRTGDPSNIDRARELRKEAWEIARQLDPAIGRGNRRPASESTR